MTAVEVCPQKYYCPGGRPVAPFDPLRPTWVAPQDTTIKRCKDGLWTQSVGATIEQQCCECRCSSFMRCVLLISGVFLQPQVACVQHVHKGLAAAAAAGMCCCFFVKHAYSTAYLIPAQ